MGAFLNEFVWIKTTRMGFCPNCNSDVIKIRQHKKCEPEVWEEGDLVKCQCCSHEGVVELHYGPELPPRDPIARIVWDATDLPGV